MALLTKCLTDLLLLLPALQTGELGNLAFVLTPSPSSPQRSDLAAPRQNQNTPLSSCSAELPAEQARKINSDDSNFFRWLQWQVGRCAARKIPIFVITTWVTSVLMIGKERARVCVRASRTPGICGCAKTPINAQILARNQVTHSAWKSAQESVPVCV